MVDLTSPEARERIVKVIAAQMLCSPECVDYPEGCGCARVAADAALAEVAAMLKEE